MIGTDLASKHLTSILSFTSLTFTSILSETKIYSNMWYENFVLMENIVKETQKFDYNWFCVRS